VRRFIGNAVAMTTTVPGSADASLHTWLLLNNQLTDFSFRPPTRTARNRVSLKRPRSSISANAGVQCRG
jgi:gamma-glutamyltranspeptidase